MDILKTILYTLMLLGSIFMVLLVLVQRGRGGGLAGALGGMGGSSAFGTRAGDLFTKITLWTAGLWILVALALARMNLAGSSSKYVNPVAPPSQTSSDSAPGSGDTKDHGEHAADAATGAAGSGSDKKAEGTPVRDDLDPSKKKPDADKDF